MDFPPAIVTVAWFVVVILLIVAFKGFSGGGVMDDSMDEEPDVPLATGQTLWGRPLRTSRPRYEVDFVRLSALLNDAADEIERTMQGNAARRVLVQTLVDDLRQLAEALKAVLPCGGGVMEDSLRNQVEAVLSQAMKPHRDARGTPRTVATALLARFDVRLREPEEKR